MVELGYAHCSGDSAVAAGSKRRVLLSCRVVVVFFVCFLADHVCF